MGATRDALIAGSLNYCTVVAIEGYPHLLTNGPTAAVVAAWAGTDFVSALPGLFIDIDRRHEFHPLKAFGEGGRVVIRVAPDAAQTFAVDLAGTDRGWRTNLTAALDSDDTTVAVKDTTNAASSGVAWIGSECFAYAGKTSTSFTTVTRGKYSPFASGIGGRFSRPHRAGLVSALNMSLEPVVSQYPRSWGGQLVGVWMCRVQSDGTVDSRAEAQLVFAGTIVETRPDENETGLASIEVLSILDRIKDASLVRDQYRARIGDGIWLRAGLKFEFSDHKVSGTSYAIRTADPLKVLTSGAATAYQMNEGYYTVESLASFINVWLRTAYFDTDLYGVYNLIAPCEVLPGYGTSSAPPGSFRTNMQWTISNGGSGGAGGWEMKVPSHVAAFLGISEAYQPGGQVSWSDSDSADAAHHEFTEHAPLRWYIPDYFGTGDDHRIRLVDQEGVAWDNYGWLPDKLSDPDEENTIGPLDPTVGAWGIFTIGGKPFVIGAVANGTYGPELRKCRRLFNHDDLNSRYEPNVDPPKIELVQVYVLHAQWRAIVAAIFYSTGTTNFNHATYDKLPQALSLGVPGELLGAAFDASILNAPEGEEWMTMIVEKPLSLEKLLNVDLILRGMHLVWQNEGLRFRQWESPIATNAVATLAETNKALPASTKGSHRAASARSLEWLTPIVKIMFGREWTSDTYQDGPLVLEDRTSIDDLGGQAPEKTLDARNMSKEQVQLIAPLFLARMPLISRPVYKTRRTIDHRMFEVITPGDCVILQDNYTRDPSSGQRGLVQPALVIGVRFAPGGANAANPAEVTPQVGEVDLVTFPGKRFAGYSPSAQVDNTVSTGGFSAGYNAGTKTLRCKAHEFSEATEARDAASFIAGDEIVIEEVSPSNPAGPISWEREVLSVNTNDIELDIALSGPSWNATKKYRIRSQIYSQAEVPQRAQAYQADEATGTINGTGAPYHYAGPAGGTPYTAEDHTAPSELVAEAGYSDGAPRDVGIERTILRTLNNLLDHKTARNSPVLRAGLNAQISQGAFVGFRMVAISDKYFGRVQSNNFVSRVLKMAPRFRSSNGTSVSVRITLCAAAPSGPTLNDVVFSGAFDQHTWTTSSTTWQDGAIEEFDLRVIGSSGRGVIVVEITNNLELRGISRCRQSERRE